MPRSRPATRASSCSESREASTETPSTSARRRPRRSMSTSTTSTTTAPAPKRPERPFSASPRTSSTATGTTASPIRKATSGTSRRTSAMCRWTSWTRRWRPRARRVASLDQAPRATLRRFVNGFQISQAVHVAATLGIADLLAEGPRASDELARETETDPEALYRLLRALAAAGVFSEEEGRRFALTELGEGLRSDAPGSLAGWAAYIAGPASWQAWGALLHSVRTGENA